MLMYGARLNDLTPTEITRHWPSGLFSILLGLQTMSASLAAGTFIARRRALMLAPQARPHHRSCKMASLATTPAAAAPRARARQLRS